MAARVAIGVVSDWHLPNVVTTKFDRSVQIRERALRDGHAPRGQGAPKAGCLFADSVERAKSALPRRQDDELRRP